MSDVPNNFNIVVRPHGWEFAASPAQTLLEAARAAGIVLPSSCRNGTCRTCMCLMQGGTVKYKMEWPGLSREEKGEGYILPCVASAESDLVLDVPAAMRSVP
ncbi:2Fe-2S iron-sulfur cluster-binding protein [Undibacterium sp.]|jgi:ferredoxin|uniref:2Fe-2S iron-sulfur cluster-binding protein n=1 Tax=Undibacterium sp. TaxID=1914977 RepID=UPI002C52D0F3|nr:2Fe-2S iron-sulfur cluster-binding protein [Undibacterium sp.]HTD03149.1 2Fe-2S iron-sulfur cluster-binding protein [Undibacterium sp.]